MFSQSRVAPTPFSETASHAENLDPMMIAVLALVLLANRLLELLPPTPRIQVWSLLKDPRLQEVVLPDRAGVRSDDFALRLS